MRSCPSVCLVVPGFGTDMGLLERLIASLCMGCAWALGAGDYFGETALRWEGIVKMYDIVHGISRLGWGV